MASLARAATAKYMNETWILGKDVRTPRSGGQDNYIFMYPVDEKCADEIEDGKMGYFKRVLRFCLSTNIHEKTGLTMSDLMALDRATFDYLEKEYYAFKPVEQDALNQALNDLKKLGSSEKNR